MPRAIVHSRRLAGLAAILASLPALAPRARGQDAPAALAVTAAEALKLAARQSPAVLAGEAAVAAAEGQHRQAGLFRFNPVAEVEAGQRRAPDDRSSTDFSVSLSQELEIGGQRGKRSASARADLLAAEALHRRGRQLIAAEVLSAHCGALRARALLGVQEQDTELARRFAALSGRRFDRGAASQIERNFAGAALGRAERELRLAMAEYREAQARLAEAIGLGATREVTPVEATLPAVEESPQLPDLLASARGQRPDFQALEHALEAAEQRRALARSERAPGLSLGAFYAEEASVDRILGGGLSIALPIFNRNQGGIAEATALVSRVRAEVASAELAIERDIVSAHARLVAATAAVLRLHEQVVGALDENLALLERAFDAGKIGATEMVLFRRELVLGHRDYVMALADARQARITLDLATGTLALPSGTED